MSLSSSIADRRRSLVVKLALPAGGATSHQAVITPIATVVDLEPLGKLAFLPSGEAHSTSAIPLPSPPKLEWHHILSDRTPAGPVEESCLADRIRSGVVHRDTLVWRPGMTQWTEASLVAELQAYFAKVPPPIPPVRDLRIPPLPPSHSPVRQAAMESFPWPDHGIPWNPEITYGVFVDPRDGHKYRTVKIGKQTWFAENLAFNAPGSWVYENKPENEAKYGRLYYWETATRACPEGWHLPSDEEWSELERFVGEDAGKKLKSTQGWEYDGNGTDNFGFRALPVGYRDSDGSFFDVGLNGYWWSATVNDASNAWVRDMDYYFAYVRRYDGYKTTGFSLRCLQNWQTHGTDPKSNSRENCI